MLKTSKIINKLIFLTPLEDNFACLYLYLFPRKQDLISYVILCILIYEMFDIWTGKKRQKR